MKIYNINDLRVVKRIKTNEGKIISVYKEKDDIEVNESNSFNGGDNNDLSDK